MTKDLPAGCLPAGKGCDTDAIVEDTQTRGMQVVIPPRCNRRQPRHYDACLHKLRHLVENAFLRLKQWRGIATRHAGRSASFLAAVQLRRALLWAQIS